MNLLIQLFLYAVNTVLIAIPLCLLIFLIRTFAGRKIKNSILVFIWCIVFFRLFIPVNITTPLGLFEKDIFKISNVPQQISNELENQSSYTEDMEVSVEAVIPKLRFSSGVKVELDHSFDAIRASTIIWILGMIVFGLYFIISSIRLRSEIGNSIYQPQIWKAELEKARHFLNIKRDIDLKFSDNIESPGIYSILKPTILIPKFLADKLTDSEIQNILMHELLHYKKGHLLIYNILAIINGIFWFNPFMWLLSGYLKQDLECFCDCAVVQHIGQKRASEYCMTILNLMQIQSKRPSSVGLLSMVNKKRFVFRRVHQIFKVGRANRWISLIAAAVMFFSSFVVFAYSSTIPISAMENEDQRLPANETVTEQVENIAGHNEMSTSSQDSTSNEGTGEQAENIGEYIEPNNTSKTDSPIAENDNLNSNIIVNKGPNPEDVEKSSDKEEAMPATQKELNNILETLSNFDSDSPLQQKATIKINRYHSSFDAFSVAEVAIGTIYDSNNSNIFSQLVQLRTEEPVKTNQIDTNSQQLLFDSDGYHVYTTNQTTGQKDTMSMEDFEVVLNPIRFKAEDISFYHIIQDGEQVQYRIYLSPNQVNDYLSALINRVDSLKLSFQSDFEPKNYSFSHNVNHILLVVTLENGQVIKEEFSTGYFQLTFGSETMPCFIGYTIDYLQ